MFLSLSYTHPPYLPFITHYLLESPLHPITLPLLLLLLLRFITHPTPFLLYHLLSPSSSDSPPDLSLLFHVLTIPVLFITHVTHTPPTSSWTSATRSLSLRFLFLLLLSSSLTLLIIIITNPPLPLIIHPPSSLPFASLLFLFSSYS